ncbi:MAG: hypothetical protein AAF936_10535 [Pseudomonadota bacterium]
MRILWNMVFALAGSVILTSSALAHPGHESELGMTHVMTSLAHISVFIGLGVSVAILMLARNAVAVTAANAILLACILLLGVTHGMYGGLLFGLETMIAGAALALGVWRLIQTAYSLLLRTSEVSDE